MLEGVGLNEFRVVQHQYYIYHASSSEENCVHYIVLWLQSLVLGHYIHKVVTG